MSACGMYLVLRSRGALRPTLDFVGVGLASLSLFL